jgi:predicted nucleotidyltransferase
MRDLLNVEGWEKRKKIIFGSYARGEFNEDSDLDFLIIKKDTPYQGRDRARELRRLIKKNIACDFLVYRPEEFEERLKLGDPFIKSILEEGIIIYGG